MRAGQSARALAVEARDNKAANPDNSRDRIPAQTCGGGRAREEATCLQPGHSRLEDEEKLLTGLCAPMEAEEASRDEYLALQICSEAWQLQLATKVALLS